MTEKIRTEAEMQARREFLQKAGEADIELAATIPEKCSSCDEARIQAYVLGNRVAEGLISLDEAKTNFINDTAECEGEIYKSDVYDGRPDCWRKRQLGRAGCLKGLKFFTD